MCWVNLWIQFIQEIANKIQQCIKIYYSVFIWSSTCFGRHIAHHQELKTALAASGFAYLRCYWTLSFLDAVSVQQLQCPTTFYVCKTRGCYCNFRLLIMGSVSPETCWASYKHGIINFDTLLYLVGYFCMNYTMMHGSTNIKFLSRSTWSYKSTPSFQDTMSLRRRTVFWNLCSDVVSHPRVTQS